MTWIIYGLARHDRYYTGRGSSANVKEEVPDRATAERRALHLIETRDDLRHVTFYPKEEEDAGRVSPHADRA